MTAAGLLGLAVTLVVVDPLRSRTWAAGLVLGILLLGLGLLLAAGGTQPAVWV